MSVLSVVVFRKNSIVYVCLGCLFLALGGGAAAYRTEHISQNYHRLTSKWSGKITARIAEVDMMDGQVRLLLEDIEGDGLADLHRVRIGFRLQKKTAVPENVLLLRPGHRIRAYVHLFPIPVQETPLNYDFEFWSFFQKIEAVGYGGAKSIRLRSKQTNPPFFESLRYSIAQKIRAANFGQLGEVAAALITGYRNGIYTTIRDDFAGSGLAHLLAISGLHLSLIAGLMFVIFRRGLCLSSNLALHWPLKKIAAALALVCSFFYLKISGESLPTVRAFIMVSLIMVAIILDREPISLRSVAWAALIILGLKPESMYSPSFQMSFSAVTALIGAYEYFKTMRVYRLKGEALWYQRVLRYFGGAVLSSLIASVATLPFIIHTFHRFSWHSVEANLIAIPLMSFWIMPLAILVLILMPAGLHIWPLKAMGWGTKILIQLAEIVNSWPGSFIPVGVQHDYFMPLILLGSAWLLIWTYRWRYLGILPIIFSLFLPAKNIFLLVSHDQERMGILSDRRILLTHTGRSSFVSQDWRGIVGAEGIRKLSKNREEEGDGWCVYPFGPKELSVAIQRSDVKNCDSDVLVKGYPKINEVRLRSGERVGGGAVFWVDRNHKIQFVVPKHSAMPWRLKQ